MWCGSVQEVGVYDKNVKVTDNGRKVKRHYFPAVSARTILKAGMRSKTIPVSIPLPGLSATDGDGERTRSCRATSQLLRQEMVRKHHAITAVSLRAGSWNGCWWGIAAFDNKVDEPTAAQVIKYVGGAEDIFKLRDQTSAEQTVYLQSLTASLTVKIMKILIGDLASSWIEAECDTRSDVLNRRTALRTVNPAVSSKSVDISWSRRRQ